MMGNGGDLSNALFEKESTMYLRNLGIDDSTGANGILFGRGGGDLLWPLAEGVGMSFLLHFVLVEVSGCIANSSRLKVAAQGLRLVALLESMYFSAGVGLGKDGGNMYVAMQALLLKKMRSILLQM